jgi:hypothetical protein
MLAWKATAAAPVSQSAGTSARWPRSMRRPESVDARSHSDNCTPTRIGLAHRKLSPMMSRQASTLSSAPTPTSQAPLRSAATTTSGSSGSRARHTTTTFDVLWKLRASWLTPRTPADRNYVGSPAQMISPPRYLTSLLKRTEIDLATCLAGTATCPSPASHWWKSASLSSRLLQRCRKMPDSPSLTENKRCR